MYKTRNKKFSGSGSLSPAFNNNSVKLAVFLFSATQNVTINDLARKYNQQAK